MQVSLGPKKFHWFARTASGIHVNKAVLKGVGAVSCDVDLKPLVLGATKISKATQVAVEISGAARANLKPGRLGVAAAVSNSAGLIQGLGQVPDALPLNAKNSWQSFRFTDVVPLSRLGGLDKLDKLSLSFLPCPRLESCYGAGKQCGDIDLKDLKVSVRALPLYDIGGREISVY
jgi:hypothetical protein